jgi:hypothetical protein
MIFRHRQCKSADKAATIARRMARRGLFCQVWFDPYKSTFKVDIWEPGNLVPQKALRPFLVAYNPTEGRFVWYAVTSYGLP